MNDANVASNGVACVVLASGYSRRYGDQDKLYARLDNGKPMIEQTLSIYRSVFERVFVIGRPTQHSTLDLEGQITLLPNHSSDQGMSQSIVQAVKNVPTNTGWLIALADMPYLEPQTVSSIIQKASPNNIVQPIYGARPGNPVFFGRNYADSLLNLKGDRGAQDVIKQATSKNVVQLPVDDPGVTQDVDRPEDIQV